jgi:hypothetical protein
MEISDTSLESKEIVNRLYRQMPEGEKLLRVFYACRTGRALALAGLAMRYPQASGEQLQILWKRQHLGTDLFTEVYGKQTAEKLPDGA